MDEHAVIQRAFEEARGRLEELFHLTLGQAEATGPLVWRAVPDAGLNEAGEFAVDAWFLYIHERPTELVGGREDGAELDSGYAAVLNPLLEAMRGEDGGPPHVEFSCEVRLGDPLGIPHIVVEGVYRGLDVCLYLFARPPADERPIRRSDQSGWTWPVEDEDDGDEA